MRNEILSGIEKDLKLETVAWIDEQSFVFEFEGRFVQMDISETDSSYILVLASVKKDMTPIRVSSEILKKNIETVQDNDVNLFNVTANECLKQLKSKYK